MKQLKMLLLASMVMLLTACGGSSSGSVEESTNIGPIANAGPDQDMVHGVVKLDGSDSYSPDGIITAYEWRDGTTLLSTAVSFEKSDFHPGLHTITLRILDNNGGFAKDNVNITVINASPEASDFNMTLDVNNSTVIEDWKLLSNAKDTDGDTLLATILTQGDYGTFAISGDSLSYTKTTETKEPDTGILEITDGAATIQITVTVNSLYWKQASGGDEYTCAIKSDGTLWCWGNNFWGQLGNGTLTSSSIPVQESTLSSDWESVSAGSNFTIALKFDGTVWGWGNNGHGQLGNGTRNNSYSVPVQESTKASDWKSISSGMLHTVALKSDGTLWGWGYNGNGQLGDGTSTSSSIPVQEITFSSDWESASAGSDFTVALKFDGTVWGWGSNDYGQLGNGTITIISIPVQEHTLSSDWKSVSSGMDHTVALKSDGTLWGWGYNGNGQLGDGTTTDSSIPVQEHTLSSDWSSVAGGVAHTTAIKLDGTLWGWGNNGNGQLGDGTTTDSSIPVQESTLSSDWESASDGAYFTLAIKSNGALWGWGSNGSRQLGDLGDANTLNKYVPTILFPREY